MILIFYVVSTRNSEALECDLENWLKGESIPALVNLFENGRCEQHFIEERKASKELHCMDYCYRTQNCQSVNYDGESRKCKLMAVPIDPLLANRCLVTSDSVQNSGPVLIKSMHIDIKRTKFMKVNPHLFTFCKLTLAEL